MLDAVGDPVGVRIRRMRSSGTIIIITGGRRQRRGRPVTLRMWHDSLQRVFVAGERARRTATTFVLTPVRARVSIGRHTRGDHDRVALTHGFGRRSTGRRQIGPGMRGMHVCRDVNSVGVRRVSGRGVCARPSRRRRGGRGGTGNGVVMGMAANVGRSKVRW